MADIQLRPIAPEQLRAYIAVAEAAFGFTVRADDADTWGKMLEYDRTIAAHDGGQIVGTAAVISFQLTLPGGTITPAAGVTLVTVLPTHTRRGILSSMMRKQLADVRDRSESVAILLASESIIYGRYGYGLATTQATLEIERRYGAFNRAPMATGTLELIDGEAAATVLPSVYERAWPLQPGFVNRSDVWWQDWLKDPEVDRKGASGHFYVTYAKEGCVDGYLAYRVKTDWQQGIARNVLQVVDLIAITSEAYAALWQYCLSLDLAGFVRAGRRSLDEPLRWMLADPRRMQYVGVADHLWARLVDIGPALAARRYMVSGEIVLAVTDPFCPENDGTYRLTGGPDGAECRRVRSDADIALQVDDLGAVYLGGAHFSTLAYVGRVDERSPGALQLADAMFASNKTPWCANDF